MVLKRGLKKSENITVWQGIKLIRNVAWWKSLVLRETEHTYIIVTRFGLLILFRWASQF